uniref:Uncharacterized protein n=1 Tax=Arundo donax TaxID=35708 RepID=A0A0A9BB12_ARUDO
MTSPREGPRRLTLSTYQLMRFIAGCAGSAIEEPASSKKSRARGSSAGHLLRMAMAGSLEPSGDLIRALEQARR